MRLRTSPHGSACCSVSSTALRALARADCQADPAPIPLAFSGQIYEVPIRIGRTVLSFVLDTRAVRNVIDRATAQRLHRA